MNFNLLDDNIHSDNFQELSTSLLQKIQKLGYAALFCGILLLVFTLIFGTNMLLQIDRGISKRVEFILVSGTIVSTAFFCSIFSFILFRTCRLQIQNPQNLDPMRHIINLIMCIWISIIIGTITILGTFVSLMV